MTIERLSVAHLRAFLATAAAGSQVEAAAALGVSQATVSRTIGALEDMLGTVLFDLNVRAELTPAGGRLLPLAQAALQQLEALREQPATATRPPVSAKDIEL